jgi:hypothetical protein
MRFRLLIADLMVLVVTCSIGAYALYTYQELLPDVAFALYLALVCLASLGAKFRRGNRPMKMFWKGFALFGWFYLVFGLQLGFIDGSGDRQLTNSLIGIAFCFISAYVTRRLVTRDPHPSRPGQAVTPPTVG